MRRGLRVLFALQLAAQRLALALFRDGDVVDDQPLRRIMTGHGLPAVVVHGRGPEAASNGTANNHHDGTGDHGNEDEEHEGDDEGEDEEAKKKAGKRAAFDANEFGEFHAFLKHYNAPGASPAGTAVVNNGRGADHGSSMKNTNNHDYVDGGGAGVEGTFNRLLQAFHSRSRSVLAEHRRVAGVDDAGLSEHLTRLQSELARVDTSSDGGGGNGGNDDDDDDDGSVDLLQRSVSASTVTSIGMGLSLIHI